MIQTGHVLERTNEKGEPFIGQCVLCGASGLSMQQANEHCANHGRVSRDEAAILAIEGDD